MGLLEQKEKYTAHKPARQWLCFWVVCIGKGTDCALYLCYGLEVKIHQGLVVLISCILWLQFIMEPLIKSPSNKMAVRATFLFAETKRTIWFLLISLQV